MAENNQSKGSGFFVGGFLLGAAMGAVTGLLVAPQTGRETRRILKKSANALPELAEDLSSNVQVQADRLSSSAVRNWEGTLTRLRRAIAAGTEASQQERQRLERITDETTSSQTEAQSASSEP
ncbi:MAG: YtxH domain-containing protein [Elainellaceae cyanobacterium]